MNDPVKFTQILVDVYERTQPLILDVMSKHNLSSNETNIDPLNLKDAMTSFTSYFFSNPQKMLNFQLQYWTDFANLVATTSQAFFNQTEFPVHYDSDKTDKRFKNDAWTANPYYNFLKQYYFMNARWLESVIESADELNPEERHKILFQTRQLISALSPTNYLMTNPEVMAETIRTNGDNLVRGFQKFIEDCERGNGEINISTTNYSQFKVGENLAITKGAVVYKNDLIELIQYNATTESVYKIPLLIIPPWINKYYILDLKAENSFIKWAVDQGFTVFTISWRNPDKSLAHYKFDNYVNEGALAALDAIKEITGEEQCNSIGYCIGGTLQAMTLSYLKANNLQNRINTATFFTTLIDFEKSGELKMFMNDQLLQVLDQEIMNNGIFSGAIMKKTFSMLRPNDLVWSFVINNYLLGKEPFPFDILYWNDDSTDMPAQLHRDYISECYMQNNLIKPHAMTINNTQIDISSIDNKAYFLSTREDHIAPWRATYAGARLLSGDTTFVLSASGHVAGVVNPPAKQKYNYWVNNTLSPDPEVWLDNATAIDGSWWPHWSDWQSKESGNKIPAREITESISPAPGSYVRSEES
jgi:polyhydroxyalkanoate synthase